MVPRRQNSGQVRAISARDAHRHAEHANQFARAAQDAYQRGDYYASAGIAINAGIQAGDAVSGFLTATRWAGREHGQAIKHLEALGPDGQDVARHLRALLPVKTLYQYDAAQPTEQDAHKLLQAALRAVAVANRVLERHR